jgi:hypothetical protein
MEKYVLKPPSKRVNYQKLKMKFPFGREIEEKNSRRIFVKILSLKKGVPKANSQIYLPSPADLLKIS